ncbi:MAG: site-specific integrase [Muricauda sp.]|nr:site-specific integrase [Allomuricauda sp.]MBA4746849.1 site-specific integrase [Allomuricauda sp.]
MSHSFSQLFYLKGKHFEKDVKVPIYLRLTVNGQRSELSVSRKVDPQKWSARMGKMKGTNFEANELNQYLDTVRSKINRIHRQLVEDNKPFTSSDVKNLYLGKGEKLKMLLELFDEHNQQMKKLIDIEFALGTYKRYNTTRNHVAEFIKTESGKSDIPVRDVDLKFIKGFEFFLKTVKKCNHNSALKYINNFKKIIRMAVAHEWINKDPFFIDGTLWIKSKRTKTKSRLGIPLLPTALAIIKKYKEHPKVMNEDCVLPVLSNQKSNAYLKEIADLCGIKKNLTTHLARHTFATTVTLSNGVPIETVGQMLGHKNLRTTQHYAKIIDRKVSEDMAALKGILAKEGSSITNKHGLS